MLPEVRLKVRVQGRHPQFFRKMVRKPQERLPAGAAVFVKDREGKPVGTGFYNSRSEIALRMLARESVRDVDRFVLERLVDACELRDKRLQLPKVSDGYRLCHAEGDGLPGLVIDKLGDSIVAQVYALAIMPYMEAIGQRLLSRYRGSQLLLNVDKDAAVREGIEKQPRPRPQQTTVTEHGIRYLVTPGQGHKTGFFADQRENRQRIKRLAKGRRVLDLCCNTGGFAMAASQGGAKEVRAVDLDEVVLQQAAHNVEANELAVDCAQGDAFEVLRELKPGRFDLMVLDPPKWARGKGEVSEGLKRYRDLNRLAFEKLPAGGLLLTCSCSGAVSEGQFHKTLSEAASQAGKDARILFSGGAGPDHPVALECPETRYLKVVLLELR